MSKGHKIVLFNEYQRREAIRVISQAPERSIVTITAPKRTLDQNALLWVLLGEISRAKPEGRSLTPDIWKCLFMSSAGFTCTFEPGLDGEGVVPMGFKSSRLTKTEFADLIETIYEYAARHDIILTNEARLPVREG